MAVFGVHNIHPSFADARQRDATLAALTNKPAAFDADAEFARLKGEVARIEGELASITPERIQSLVETALRPLAAEIALMEKEQVQNAQRAQFEDFTGYDLNALFDDETATKARATSAANAGDEFAGYDLNAAMEG